MPEALASPRQNLSWPLQLSVMTLNELKVRHGQTVKVQILALQGDPSLTDRLREMGFFEGTQMEVAGRLSFGGPWIVHLGAASFALRSEEAHCASVKVLP